MYKKIILIFLILSTVIFIFINPILCYANDNNKKILIIGSYSPKNKWEVSITKGFGDAGKDRYTVKAEFLDSESFEEEGYEESFINFLNVKYKDSNIDYIVTLDDEAFQLIRSKLFDNQSFIYEKNIIFAGVNNYVTLSNEESKYIKGILEIQDNLEMINTILTAGNKVNDIYLLLDESIFCKTVKENFENLKDVAVVPFNYHIIQGAYLDDIKKQIEGISPENAAIFLCGTYKKDVDDGVVSSKSLIDELQEITSMPIYTKLEEYIYDGAIGGIVNDGYKLGEVLCSLIDNLIIGSNIFSAIPAHDTFSIPIFNYKAMSKYDINPLKLPKNTVYINKKPYDLLLPKKWIAVVWFVGFIIILGVCSLIYISIVNKKVAIKNKMLLLESMEREKIKTDFIVTISHELRTPLNIIINATNLLMIKLKEDNIDVKYFQERLTYIMKNSNRLRRYINNLIDVSKLEMGYMDVKLKNQNIVNIVEEVTLAIVDLAKKFDIDVIFDTEEEEIITAIDTLKIERVILNLLSNSIKFSKNGRRIFVNMKKKEESVIIEISDEGMGMSEEFKTHLFEKFKRGDVNEGLKRQNEGSGLGLFIVKGLIELHNGTIDIISKLNEGTKIIITLPIRLVNEKENNEFIVDSSLEYLFEMEFSDIDKK